MHTEIAVLLTCYNRKEKTLSCLNSFYKAIKPSNTSFTFFIVDDCSSDGTSEAIEIFYPHIKVIKGNGNLYWAGGMRLAWQSCNKTKVFDYYLLLNDDVILKNDFIIDLLNAEESISSKTTNKGIYVSSTLSSNTTLSYGGKKLIRKFLGFNILNIYPSDKPQTCNIANANIMLIHCSVIDKIGFFDVNYTHGIADYDFTLMASKYDIPIILCRNFGGYCDDDHKKNIPDFNSTLTQRIAYLKSPIGLAYYDYLYFIKKHFPILLLPTFLRLWFRTLFPKIWKFLKK